MSKVEIKNDWAKAVYILSLNCSKGGARNIKQSLFLHIVLKIEANPKPNKIDIIILPVSV